MGSVTTNTLTSQTQSAAAGLIPTQVQTPVPRGYMIAQRCSAIQSASESIKQVKVGDDGLFETDGYYVGAERQFPLPDDIQQAWDDIIPSFSGHLDLVVRRLKQSIPPERRRVEPDLCWACQKSLLPGFRSSDLELRPTVWIRCGGLRCQRKVEQSIDDLGYFRQFLERFGMRKPVFSRDVPWTAGLVQPPYVSNLPKNIRNISLAIQREYSPIGGVPICGVRARYTIETEDSSTTQLYSTIGGAVVVSNRIYGLTTAHSIVDFLQPETSELPAVAPQSPEGKDDAASGSDSEQTPNERRIRSSESVSDLLSEWVEVPLPSAFMYRGFGTTGKENSREPAPAFCSSAGDTSDFALMQIKPIGNAFNSFYGTTGYSEIKGHLDQHELGEGEVQIITKSIAEPVAGYMLKRNTWVILHGRIMHTRRIQVDSKFEPYHGLSGAWVIQKQRLCGIIYAAYDHAPYLHMIPAYTMFENIKHILKSDVAVANLDLYPDSATTASTVGEKDKEIQKTKWQRFKQFDMFLEDLFRLHDTKIRRETYLSKPEGIIIDDSSTSLSLEGKYILYRFLVKTGKNYPSAIHDILQSLGSPEVSYADLYSEVRGYNPRLAIPLSLSTPFYIISRMSSRTIPTQEEIAKPNPVEKWRIMMDAMILLQTFTGGPRHAKQCLLRLPMTQVERESINYLLSLPSQGVYGTRGFLEIPGNSDSKLNIAWKWFIQHEMNHQSFCGFFFWLGRIGVLGIRADDYNKRSAMLEIEPLRD